VNRVVAVVGMTGSGKSAACDVLRRAGWGYIRFGRLTIDRLVEAGWEVTPDNEKRMREALRREHGMGAYAKLLLPRIEEELSRAHVVIDGLYSWSEYKILKERFPESFLVIAIHASPAIRYARLAERAEAEADPARTVRRLSPQEARRRDYAEIEGIEKGGPIAMADVMIVNEATVEALEAQVRAAVLEAPTSPGRPAPPVPPAAR
jgi:dephospho-CoA kinase